MNIKLSTITEKVSENIGIFTGVPGAIRKGFFLE